MTHIVFVEQKGGKTCNNTKEETMPHLIVKLYPGRSEQLKAQLAEQLTKDVVSILKCDEKAVSVALEEIRPEDWAETVYQPDILNKSEKLYKKPGYNPLEKQ
jgi:4-oxalocrotonate tautomerase